MKHSKRCLPYSRHNARRWRVLRDAQWIGALPFIRHHMTGPHRDRGVPMRVCPRWLWRIQQSKRSRG